MRKAEAAQIVRRYYKEKRFQIADMIDDYGSGVMEPHTMGLHRAYAKFLRLATEEQRDSLNFSISRYFTACLCNELPLEYFPLREMLDDALGMNTEKQPRFHSLDNACR